MTIENKKKLIEAGMDYETALARFNGNESMLEAFLKEFPKDPSYNAILEGIETRDSNAAFRGAHTLKGVAAYYSFDRLKEVVSNQTERFRIGKFDSGVELMEAVTAEYGKIVRAIGEIFE